MEHSDVVDHGVGVVALVVLEGGHREGDTAGAPVAGSSTDLQDGSGHGLQAVSGGHDHPGGVDGSTAGVAATALQGDLPGEAADGGSSSRRQCGHPTEAGVPQGRCLPGRRLLQTTRSRTSAWCESNELTLNWTPLLYRDLSLCGALIRNFNYFYHLLVREIQNIF